MSGTAPNTARPPVPSDTLPIRDAIRYIAGPVSALVDPFVQSGCEWLQLVFLSTVHSLTG